VPLARAEMQVIPVNMRGDEDRCNATRECEVISRRSETRATQRSNVIERAK
jgi:hypothetical protein